METGLSGSNYNEVLQLIMNTNCNYAVGVDIGGSHVCSRVVDLAAPGGTEYPVVETPVDCGAGASAVLAAWTGNIRRAISASGLGRVRNVGLAFPGPFDYERGISLIQGVRKFDRLYGLDVPESLLARLEGAGVEECRYVNDAAAFALGECFCGAASGAGRVMALTLGTGFGSGFVAAGRLLTDAPEVPVHGWVYHLPFEGGIADDAFSTRWFCRRYRALTGREVTGVKEIADRAGTEKEARRLFDEYGRRLGEFILPVFDRFRGDVLVLGGNIARAYPLFGPAFEARLADEGRKIDIRMSALLDQAAMAGAASLFWEN